MAGFKVGDRVRFNFEAGRFSGKIIDKHPEDVDYKGRTRRCSPEYPRFEINSDESEHVAMHKADALAKRD